MRYLARMESAQASLQILPIFSGGKGADLARAAKIGLKVPESFGVDPSVLKPWLKSVPHYTAAVESWRSWGAEAKDNIPSPVTEFLQALLNRPMPSSWRFSHTGSTWLVRSSMNIENNVAASFAGAFLSLKVEDSQSSSLWQAFLRVIASGYSREALAQVLIAGFDPREFVPGVLIQPFVAAKISGVAFSHDPQNPWQRQYVMEWAEGSGEGIVQGTKKTQTYRKDQGKAPPFVEPFTSELWKKVELLEKEFNRPVDIEWCWDGSVLWVIQVRPIAGQESEILSLSEERFRWTREMAEERFPQPVTMLGWTAIDDLIVSNINSLKKDFGIEVTSSSPLAVRYRGFVYSDPEFFKFPKRVRIHFGLYINPLKSRFWKLFFGLLSAVFKRILSLKKPQISKALLQMRCVVAFIGEQAERAHAAWDGHVRVSRERIEEFCQRKFSVETLLTDLEDLRKISIDFLEPDLAIFVVKDTYHQALAKIWAAIGHPPHEMSWMLSSFEGNRSLQMGEEWASLVDGLAKDPRVADFLSALEKSDPSAEQILNLDSRKIWAEFMAKHGHTRTGWDIALSSWRDDPRHLVPLLKSTLGQKEKAVAKPSAPSDRKVNGFLEDLKKSGLSASEVRWVREFIRTEHAFMHMDEELRFLSGLLLEPSRKLVMIAAKHLVDLKTIERTEDVFFLGLDELKAALRSPGFCRFALIRKRKAEWERWKNEKDLGGLPLKIEIPTAIQNDENGLRLVSASPGKASGPAFFLEHIEDAKMLPKGAILITTAPNPAYVPLYPMLSGMVTTTGGPLSHGFVAAREYGIPAVSGWLPEQKAIAAGQWIELDGNLGTLKVIDKPGGSPS